MGSLDHIIIDSLTSIGVSQERAREVSAALRREIDERYGLHAQVLATRTDLAELKVELFRELGKIQDRIGASSDRMGSIQERIAATNERIAAIHERLSETNSRIAESKVDIIKWVVGFLVAQSGLLFAAIRLAA